MIHHRSVQENGSLFLLRLNKSLTYEILYWSQWKCFASCLEGVLIAFALEASDHQLPQGFMISRKLVSGVTASS
jgi:hypothetical protein